MMPNPLAPKEATIEKSVSVSHVYYRIKGTLDAVCEAIKKLATNYDVRGYGTSVKGIRMEPDGTWIAEVSRLTNCD